MLRRKWKLQPFNCPEHIDINQVKHARMFGLSSSGEAKAVAKALGLDKSKAKGLEHQAEGQWFHVSSSQEAFFCSLPTTASLNGHPPMNNTDIIRAVFTTTVTSSRPVFTTNDISEISLFTTTVLTSSRSLFTIFDHHWLMWFKASHSRHFPNASATLLPSETFGAKCKFFKNIDSFQKRLWCS